MVLKRVNGIRYSYRFQRGTPRGESPTKTSPSHGEVIVNTEGVNVGWMLDGARTPSSGPLFSPSRSLPCSPCIHASYPHYWTIGRVKFGYPLDQVCKNNDIPGPLLVLILKLNKEGPAKKDVFRAPGHQASMKKLVHFLHNGRLVNIDNFSVYTIASVLKKFLRKLPEGIFGRRGEEELFNMMQLGDTEQQRDLVHRLIASKSVVTQHLIVLLFGTFRVIASNADRSNTGMTSEALGVSVAPSFFRSCVTHGKTASMDDVLRFKVATQIMKFMIDNFGVSNLFGRDNYEYYARITGRILKVEEDWIFAFRYPPDSIVAPMAGQEESQSTPALIHIPECGGEGGSGEGGRHTASVGSGSSLRIVVPENNLRESCTRLSISLEENGLYKGGGSGSVGCADLTLEELRQVNHYAESTKSLTFLPQVHERQTERMRTRSEWFLTPQQCSVMGSGEQCYTPTSVSGDSQPHTVVYARQKEAVAHSRKHGSDECKLLRRSSSKDKERRLVRRSSSKKDKENGQKKRDALRQRSASAEVKGQPLQQTSSQSALHSMTHTILQHSLQPLQQQNIMPLQQQNVMPLQQQNVMPLQRQNVMYNLPLQRQQLVMPLQPRHALHRQHSRELLLLSPNRRPGASVMSIESTSSADCQQHRALAVSECPQHRSVPMSECPQYRLDRSVPMSDCQQHRPDRSVPMSDCQQHRSVPLSELECTETDVQRVHVSNTYKPRI